MERLDKQLARIGMVDSRSRAIDLIRQGVVRVNGQEIEKPAFQVSPDDVIELVAGPKYVSRSGGKLEAALDHFQVTVSGWDCLDVGASTGGFTDCLLKCGARSVLAMDVGHGQIHPSLRSDPRVRVVEGLNARTLKPQHWENAFDLVVIDVSFISLTLVLPAVLTQAEKPGSQLIALIKPQFESRPEDLNRKGIVKSEGIRHKALEKITNWLGKTTHWQTKGIIDSPLPGSDGNIEFLLHAVRH